MAPRENFYDAETSDPNSAPTVVVDWATTGAPFDPAVRINGVAFDRSAINRLIRVLRRARSTVYGDDE